jgi:hypothetical protein
MEEVKRFMRYVLPGLVVVFELSLALYFSFPDKFACYAATWLANGGFGTELAIFLASGALGYLFSIIYYSLQNACKKKLFYDHSPALKSLEKEKQCIFEVGANFESLKDWSKDRRSQWELFNVVWHLSRGKHESLEKVEVVLNRLLDVLHGHGAHLVGALLGIGCWCVIVTRASKWEECWLVGGAGWYCVFALAFSFAKLKRP